MKVERVQATASLSRKLDTIPPEFIRSDHEQPGKTTFGGPVPEIPVVDLGGGGGGIDGRRDVVVEAAKQWGLFQIVNHGIPVEAIEELQRVGKEFFELPQEEKEVYALDPETMEGYGTKLQKETEGKKGWVDYLWHNIWPESKINYKFWPQNPPEYRKATQEYAKHLLGVMDEILTSLSLGLGLEGHAFKEALGGDAIELLMKINYYPICPHPDLALGVLAHTDMSAITLLLPNEVPGAQVFKDGHWFDAKYIPNAIIVHIGDQIEILSNGKYKSVLHRTTVNKERVRMSWPVFCTPPGEFAVGTLPQLVSEDSPTKYKTKKYKDCMYCKLPQ